MSKKQGKSFWSHIKRSCANQFQIQEKGPSKTSTGPRQGGVSSTRASGDVGASGASSQSHHSQDPCSIKEDASRSNDPGAESAGASGLTSKHVPHEQDPLFRQLEQKLAKTDDKVEQLEQEAKSQMTKDVKPEPSYVEKFDVKTCRSKLAEHYRRTATVPTSVWSKASPVDIHQIYTELSWVKQEQTSVGSSQSELTHYSDLFTANENGVVPKRILVQGQTGIGKSTFVKKLAVDWAELDDEKTGDEQTAALKKFELVVVVNLKEVPKCQSLSDVISRSGVFAEEDESLTEGLLDYITQNQENVLLVFDGYDEYRSGQESEIYELFRGKKLRNCSVLITTRISKADDLREFKDLHAEITGFSREDTTVFILKKVGSKEEAVGLYRHLEDRNLLGLAKVPLLLQFFCILWKKGQLNNFPKTKTDLYVEIVQSVLDHSQAKHSRPRHFDKVQDKKEILAEIGRVALEGLLNDDQVFEYEQLPASIFCEESFIIGILQVTEYAESQRPAGMVSFIHKSVQEFVAAWYITYRCIPEGNLGLVEEHVRTLEDCRAFENVFLFVCGLSDEGAVKVFKHLESVRLSDPSLDVSTTVPNIEYETDVPLCDVTERHQEFSNLVLDYFQEVQSKAELSRNCFDCVGGTILVSRPPFHELPEVKGLKSWSFCFAKRLFHISLFNDTVSNLYNSFELVNNNGFELVKVGDFLKTFLNAKCERRSGQCGFHSCLCYRDGQVYIYITDLQLVCASHVSLFIEAAKIAVPSVSLNLCSERCSLKFLRRLLFIQSTDRLNTQIFGAIIRNCKHLKKIEISTDGDYLCDLLEQVPRPSTCSLYVGHVATTRLLLGCDRVFPRHSCKLKSAEAVQLAGLLPRYDNVITLSLDLKDCCSTSVTTLVSSITTHNTLQELALIGISMTPAVAAALGQSLPELSSLETLEITGTEGGITVQAEDVEMLFGGFKKPSPLKQLDLNCFNMRGSLAPLAKRLCVFSNLFQLQLDELNLDGSDVCGLLESCTSTPLLSLLSLNGNPLGHSVSSIVPYITKLPGLWRLDLRRTGCSEEDQIYVRENVKLVRYIMLK